MNDFELSEDLQTFLGTTFWFKAQIHALPDETVFSVDISGITPDLLGELCAWTNEIEMCLDTGNTFAMSRYKADIHPYAGIFPLYVYDKRVAFCYDVFRSELLEET